MTTQQSLDRLTKGERTAQRIMDAAEELFAVKGFTSTTLRDIAEAANIREPGLYNHFKSKEDLYERVLERGLQPLADTMTNFSEEAGKLTDLHQLPAAMLQLLAQHPHMAALLQQALVPQPGSKTHAMVEAWLKDLIQSGRNVLKAIGQDNLCNEEVALRIITMFNITTGYFTSAPLFTQLTQGDILDQENIALQERILMQITKTFLLS